MASAACSKSSVFSVRSGFEECHVLAVWLAGGAGGAAVHASGGHTDEKFAIDATISPEPRATSRHRWRWWVAMIE
jgi:hypothetical protein